MQYEDRRTISTPEGLQLALPLANVGSRFMALFIDLLIAGTALLISLLVAAAAGADVAAAILAASAVLVFYVGYHVVFEVLGGGRTLGKRAAKLRVVSDSGAPVGLRASLIRNVFLILEGLGLVYLPAVISVLVTRDNQRLGDLAAGTLVIRDVKPLAAVELPPVSPEWYATWDVTGIGEEETAAVRAFLHRRDQLAPVVRRTLAAQLAERLRPRVPGVRHKVDDEGFLLLLAAAKARRNTAS